MSAFFVSHADYLLFSGVCGAVFALIAWVTSARYRARLPRAAWVILALTLAGGWFMVDRAGRSERNKIEQLLCAMAPTYALEMARMDHALINLETPAHDPLYQRLLAAERQWCAANPTANDIYTMRKLPDGKNVFIVDGETDYNRNGVIDEKREERTEIGEVYEEGDGSLERAFAGVANFGENPVTDRWGTWVTAWAPIYSTSGELDGVVGVDYDAASWLSAIGKARRQAMWIIALFLATVGATMTAIGLLRADIAKRRVIEGQLREAEERWQRTVQQMPLCFIEWNAQAEILSWNPAAEKVFGFTAQEVIGRKGLDLIVPADQPQISELWNALWSGPGGEHSVNENVTRDGRKVTVEWFNTRVPDQAGKIVAVRSLAQDLTERLSLERQMQHSQKMQSIGVLAAGLAHDFNNLLTIIMGHTELLLSRSDLPGDSSEDIDHIATAAERAAGLTCQLLTFSRQQTMFARPIQLNDTVRDAAAMLRRVLGEDIAVQCNLAPELPAVQADSAMLDQVITNLAINARDAMPRGGRLVLATELVHLTDAEAAGFPKARAGDAVVLRVTDNGTGIEPEKLKHIFEPFFTTKEVGKGTGLGLAAVHGIVEQHRGWIRVSSELRSGTTVEVFLPASAEKPVAASKVRSNPIATPEAYRSTVLVVEDQAAVRELAKRTLEETGYRVLVANDGPSAAEMWGDHREEIALLFTDMVMPNGVSGRELAARLLQQKPELPVIFASGYSLEVVAPDFCERSNQTFLQKPYSPRVLIATVERCLSRREKKTEHAAL